ncbi:hypothetical protein EVG20_g6321 [Dentipellis fragilis]|uniref:Serine aminopeptidase S33 domain-containing protein n=1 Tax=Dentipellis fragilis TaxID=205917 RepID=A0A4Y9YQV0_9AGAM|nr:hypothetical protein EVG20_g6321 [Dentipellis fragilis]
MQVSASSSAQAPPSPLPSTDPTQSVPESALTMHKDLWMPDGSVVLQAERTLFCVHMSQLLRHSFIFRDMFALPRPHPPSASVPAPVHPWRYSPPGAGDRVLGEICLRRVPVRRLGAWDRDDPGVDPGDCACGHRCTPRQLDNRPDPGSSLRVLAPSKRRNSLDVLLYTDVFLIADVYVDAEPQPQPTTAMAASEPYTEEWLTGPASTTFYTRTYLPPAAPSTSTSPPPTLAPKAALVFVHGFIEHIGRYTHVHDGLGRARGSKYGRTSSREQMLDVKWAVGSAKERWGAPVFLMGHSMGGGIALSFAAGGGDTETVSMLAGVIASSPLLHLTHPPLGLVRWAGGKLGMLLPDQYIPATVKPETLSHDPQIAEDNKKDKLCGKGASLRCVDDMLSKGVMLVESGYKSWPADLPVLLFHGTADEVNLFDATKEFFEKVPAKDKTFTPYEGGFHELHNEPDGVKEKVIEDCIAWAEARVPAAPGSGSAARL